MYVESTYEMSSLNQKMSKFNMFITAVCFLFLIKPCTNTKYSFPLN